MRLQLAREGRGSSLRDAHGVTESRDLGGLGRRISLGSSLIDGYAPLDDVHWEQGCLGMIRNHHSAAERETCAVYHWHGRVMSEGNRVLWTGTRTKSSSSASSGS